VDTGFIERCLVDLGPRPTPSGSLLTVAAAALMACDDEAAAGPWTGLTGFRLNAVPETTLRVFVDGEPTEATSAHMDFEADILMVDGSVVLFEGGETYTVSSRPPVRDLATTASGDGEIRSPMPGKVVSVNAAVGDRVAKGGVLMVLEAMKMEHALAAPFDGILEALSVSAGDQVSEGISLARMKAAPQ